MQKQIRVMDERGYVPIPVSIMDELGIKAAELPQFEVCLEKEPQEHISLYLTGYVKDDSPYIHNSMKGGA